MQGQHRRVGETSVYGPPVRRSVALCAVIGKRRSVVEAGGPEVVADDLGHVAILLHEVAPLSAPAQRLDAESRCRRRGRERGEINAERGEELKSAPRTRSELGRVVVLDDPRRRGGGP